MTGVSIIETETLNNLINKVESLQKTVGETIDMIKNPQKQYLTAKDVMAITGFSRFWLTSHQQYIGYTTIGDSIRFKRADLEAYIEANYIKIKKR